MIRESNLLDCFHAPALRENGRVNIMQTRRPRNFDYSVVMLLESGGEGRGGGTEEYLDDAKI